MSDETIKNMRGRAAQCRRLAAGTLDDRVKTTLLKMAEEIDADIKRLERDGLAPQPRPEPT